MLLTIDVGNTNTVLGVFRGPQLIANWRLTTAREQTVDEYGVLTRNLFTLAGLDRNDITGVIISSVVPPVNWTLGEMSRVYFGKKALFVDRKSTRLNSSHVAISYAVFCLKKKKKRTRQRSAASLSTLAALTLLI